MARGNEYSNPISYAYPYFNANNNAQQYSYALANVYTNHYTIADHYTNRNSLIDEYTNNNANGNFDVYYHTNSYCHSNAILTMAYVSERRTKRGEKLFRYFSWGWFEMELPNGRFYIFLSSHP